MEATMEPTPTPLQDRDQIPLRLPKPLMRKVRRRAEMKGVSVNAYITIALEANESREDDRERAAMEATTVARE